jgi:hypothetical protein
VITSTLTRYPSRAGCHTTSRANYELLLLVASRGMWLGDAGVGQKCWPTSSLSDRPNELGGSRWRRCGSLSLAGGIGPGVVPSPPQPLAVRAPAACVWTIRRAPTGVRGPQASVRVSHRESVPVSCRSIGASDAGGASGAVRNLDGHQFALPTREVMAGTVMVRTEEVSSSSPTP